MRVLALLFLLLFYLPPCFAQTALPDSLLQVLEGPLPDSVRAEVLIRLARTYRRSADKAADATAYAAQAVELARKARLPQKEVEALDFQGVLFRDSGQYSEALEAHKKALKIAREQALPVPEMQALNNIGVVFRRIDNLEEANVYHLEALKIARSLSDARNTAVALNSLGNINLTLRNLDQALEYLTESLALEKAAGNDLGVAINLNNIGWIYKERKDYDQALRHLQESLAYNEKINSQKGMAICYNDIGAIHETINDREKALVFYKKALSMNEKLGDLIFTAQSHINIGHIYTQKGELQEAEQYLRTGLETSLSIGAKQNVLDAFTKLSALYERRKDSEQALAMYKRAMLYRDSIYNETNNRNISLMQTRYEMEKKEAQIALLQAEGEYQTLKLKDQSRISMFMGLMTVLATVLLFTFIRMAQQEKKSNTLLTIKNQEISDKKEEIQAQSEVLYQKNQEITDSIHYARRIQQAVLGTPAEALQPFCQPSGTARRDGFIFYKPRDIVSGDFYWFAEVLHEGQHVKIMVVADCTGHGVPGALMTAIGHSFLNEIVKERFITKPADILTTLDQKVTQSLKTAEQSLHDGMDIAVLALDEQAGILLFAGAKSGLLYQPPAGEAVLLKGSPFPIGSMQYRRAKVFEQHSLPLAQVKCCYLYSDGFQDQFGGPENKKYMSRRFREFLLAGANLPAHEQAARLEKELAAWQHANRQTDDILVVGLQFA